MDDLLTTYERDGNGVGLLRLDRPAARNAINTQMLEELLGHIEAARADEDLRVLVLSSTDHMGFSAGADVREDLDREGEKVVMWYVSSNRDETRYEDADTFDVTRKPEHQAFGAGGRHFCLGTALARLELRILIEETLKRYPNMKPNGEAKPASTAFLNQFKTLPVRLG